MMARKGMTMKNRNCKTKKMAEGGAVFPQERPVTKPQQPDWRQSLAAAWNAIKGNREAQQDPKPTTANTIVDTAGALVERKVDNLDAMKRAGYAMGGIPGFEDDAFPQYPEEAVATSRAPSPGGNMFANPSAGNMLSRPDIGGVKARTDAINSMQGISDRQRVQALTGVAGRASQMGIQTDIAGMAGGVGNLSNKQQLAVGQAQFGVDTANDVLPARLRRNFAAGGMTTFKGEGGPRDDKIPVTVAGEKINVSNDEAGLILPAKTAKNPQAVAAIGSIIEQTNDGRKPKMGIKEGGKYASGATGSYADDEPLSPVQGGVLQALQKHYANTGLVPGSASPAMPNTVGAIQKYGDEAKAAADAGNIGAAFGQVGRGVIAGGVGVVDDAMGGAARVIDPFANALKTMVTGDSTPARAPDSAQSAAQANQTSAPAGNEGRNSAVVAANNLSDPKIARNTGNAGDARVDPATGNLHFPQPGFDPTQMSVSDGAGAITSTATGRTIAIPPRAPEQAPDNRPRDAYGNDMTRTLELRDQLNRQRIENAWDNLNAANPAYHQKGRQQMQALAKMGELDDATAKRLWLQQKQQRESDASGLLMEKGRGEVADSAAARMARQGLALAYDSGDQNAINQATLKAIANGVIKPTPRSEDYHVVSDTMGNQTRLNKVTGQMEVLDRQTNALKPVSVASQIPEFASESDVRSAQKSGKLKVGQKVMVGGRQAIVTAD